MQKVYGLVLAALFGMGVMAQAETKPVDFQGKLTINDNAGTFSEAGAKKAKDAFNGTTFKAKTTWHIHTVSQIPDGKKAEFDTAKKTDSTRHEFFRNWVKEIANDRGNPSITTLIYTTDKNYYVETHTDKAADIRRDFTSADVKIMDDKIRAVFSKTLKGKIVGTAAHSDHDAGLDSATDYVINHLKDTTVSNPNGKNLSDSPTGEKKMSIGGWICIGLIAVLLIWLVIGVIRALTGSGGGGGYGGGGYGGGGGGGGGFLTGLMGGMFGAMAGMWMYNHFMGGNHASDYGSSGDGYGGGNDYGNGNTGEGDYSSGAEDGGGGGDWGDSGGGDTGGGGDWGGGGGDSGGGGDFGGGGGDW